MCQRSPLASYLYQKMEAEGEKNIEELSSVPSAVSEPRLAVHMCDDKCRAQGFKCFPIAVVVSEEGGPAHTINFCRNCCTERRVKWCEVDGADRT